MSAVIQVLLCLVIEWGKRFGFHLLLHNLHILTYTNQLISQLVNFVLQS